jgi:hypothetical protein
MGWVFDTVHYSISANSPTRFSKTPLLLRNRNLSELLLVPQKIGLGTNLPSFPFSFLVVMANGMGDSGLYTIQRNSYPIPNQSIVYGMACPIPDLTISVPKDGGGTCTKLFHLHANH